ncbi:hypothetical protein ACTAB2_26405 (plasmid) [Pseudomonas syringae]|uniref:hypothetical protein n=1 Tax=Pseudomonas syringae TaxID=317 RepID=UPI003F7AECCA|nr:hypothetical protein [Pseudomonas syringae pv. actinidiae]
MTTESTESVAHQRQIEGNRPMKDEHEDIELKEVLEQSFATGHGVVTLSASMTDEQILTLIKSACTWSKGKAFQVIPSQPKACSASPQRLS